MDFRKKVTDALTTGAAKTRDLYSKARAQVKGLGNQAALALEISQLEKDTQRKLADLGSTVYRLLATEGKASISRSTAGVKTVLAELARIDGTVRSRKAELEEMRKKGGES